MKSVGRHLVLELWECQELNCAELLEKALLESVDACGAHLLDLRVHTFSPQGVTGVAVVSESHIMIHTWPELNYAAVDVFTCGDSTEPQEVIPVIRKYFQPARMQILELRRGILDD